MTHPHKHTNTQFWIDANPPSVSLSAWTEFDDAVRACRLPDPTICTADDVIHILNSEQEYGGGAPATAEARATPALLISTEAAHDIVCDGQVLDKLWPGVVGLHDQVNPHSPDFTTRVIKLATAIRDMASFFLNIRVGATSWAKLSRLADAVSQRPLADVHCHSDCCKTVFL